MTIGKNKTQQQSWPPLWVAGLCYIRRNRKKKKKISQHIKAWSLQNKRDHFPVAVQQTENKLSWIKVWRLQSSDLQTSRVGVNLKHPITGLEPTTLEFKAPSPLFLWATWLLLRGLCWHISTLDVWGSRMFLCEPDRFFQWLYFLPSKTLQTLWAVGSSTRKRQRRRASSSTLAQKRLLPLQYWIKLE